MQALGKMKIGIRAQSVCVIVVMALWYLSLAVELQARKGHLADLSLFWDALYVLSPWTGLLLAAILLISRIGSGRQHLWWVCFAVILAISPWLVVPMIDVEIFG